MLSTTVNLHRATFTISAPDIRRLPADNGIEVAFAGRSNAGKSSALNTLTNQKSLARTSKTPGRTQLINFFSLPEGKFLVDLPGYGYAKVPDKVKREWQRFIESYLTQRFPLCGLVIVMDIRRPMLEYDLNMLAWTNTRDLPVHVVLNKSDKLKHGQAKTMLLNTQKQLKEINPLYTAQIFSSLKGVGVKDLENQLDSWLNKEKTEL